jgi:copper transport protein
MTPPRRSPRTLARLVATATLVVAALLATVAPAGAHAQLTSTSPYDGETVAEPPPQVTLTFNEGVDAATGAIRVYDDQGERVDDATVVHDGERTVGVGLEGTLDEGAYVVTWRATSEDGHPVKGAFVFSVGDGGDVDEALLTRLFSGDGDAIVQVLAGAARIASYLGVLLAAGLLLVTRIVRPAADETGRLVRLVRRGAWVALVATVLTVPLQAMLTTGFGPVAALRPAVLGEVLASSVGVAAGVRSVALAAVLALAATGPVALGAGVVATLSFVIDGHSRTVDPAALMLAGDATHLLAVAAWVGVVAGLVVLVRGRRLEDDPVGAATAVARASGIATVAVVVVVVAGVAMSWALVREPRALTSTAYGWTLLAKVALAAMVVAVGSYNNRRLVPAVRRALTPVPAGASTDVVTDPAPVDGLARAGWRRLGATVRAEAWLLVAVVVVTGALVNLRPAAEAAGITGAYETTVEVTDELSANVVVDPNVAGANEIHVYLLDATGRPTRDVDGVRMRLTLPAQDIGPIERTPLPAGPGHWVLSGGDLAIPGAWDIDVVVEVDSFTEERLTVPVVVNAP